MNPVSSIVKSRKFKYGSISVIFTAVVVAVIITINVITTSIHINTQPLMIDMSKEQIYSISDASKEILKDIKAPVKFIFLQDLDSYEKSASGGSMIVQLAKEYAAQYDNVTIEVIDSLKKPTAINKYKSSSVSTIKRDSIIVEGEFGHRIITNASMFVIAESTQKAFGFKGEVQLTSSVMQVTSRDEMPVVYFTTGHGESVPAALSELFTTAGYVIEELDLSKNAPEADNKLMVVCAPQKDFGGITDQSQSGTSEIERLDAFLDNDGNVMYFTDPRLPALANLEELLSEYGVGFEHGLTVVDEKNSIGNDPYALDTKYIETSTAGDELHGSIRKLDSLPKTIMYYSMPIKLLWGDETKNSTKAATVLASFDTAYATDGDKKMIEGKQIPLMVLSQRMRYDKDNNAHSSFVLVCGSTYYLDSNFLVSNTYANADIMTNAMRIMGQRKIPVDLDFKPFDTESLADLSTVDANNWTLVISLVLPLIVSVLAVVVFVRRRHS
ncbi:MAG: Gldg family protein [Eubacteriales bacterium]